LSNISLIKNNKLYDLLINIFFYNLDKKIYSIKTNFLENFLILNLNLKSKDDIKKTLLFKKVDIKFIRYHDTFIIGVKGNKEQVNEIKNEIVVFLKNKLYLNNVYSYIIDIYNDSLEFNNSLISSGLKTSFSNRTRNVLPDSLSYNRIKGISIERNYKLILLTSRYLLFKILKYAGILNRYGKVIYPEKLLNYNINEIIIYYINIILFILYSFSDCQDFFRFSKFILRCIYISLKLIFQEKLTYSFKNINLLYKLGLVKINIFKYFYYLKINNIKLFRRKFLTNSFSYILNNTIRDNQINFLSKKNLELKYF
jgi:hypothetical protein